MMIFGFVTSFAQMQKERNLVKRVQKGFELNTSQQNLPIPVLNTKVVNEDIERIFVGTCDGYRSVRREETHVISYNTELDAISITFSLDPATYEEADDRGVTGMFYSTDKGQTWEGPVVVSDHTADNLIDVYMSGIIYNPIGNTNITDAYGVSQGTNETWKDYMFGSNKLSGDEYFGYYFEETDPDCSSNGYLNQFGLNQYDDKVRAMNVYKKNPDDGPEELGLEPITATFNNGEFSWEFEDVEDMDLLEQDDGTLMWRGQWVGNDVCAEIAWSKDGETGYMWVIGVSNDWESDYQPVMVATTDAGDSWDVVEIDFFSDDAQDFFEPYLYEIHTGMMIPSCYESAGTVDANGDLQLFLLARSAATDAINYPDSIGWVYGGDYGHIFNVEISTEGIQEIMWVDSIDTQNINLDPPNYAGNVAWQHRISAAKSPDEKQIFVTWIDSRGEMEDDKNIEPDIFGWSKNIVTNDYTESVCLTEGTIYEGYYYFTYGADIAYANDAGGYTIPYLQAVSPEEFSTNSSSDPLTISYVTGIEFSNLVGINEINGTIAGISVTQNQPNPFHGTTTITVKTEASASVMVEVSNIMGQTIYTINAGIINGTQEIVLPAENLEAGIYFYTVRIGNESISKKMIVE